MERTPEHPTLLDGAACDLGGPRTMAFLDKCERLIPWDELAGSVADVFWRPAQGAVSRGGRPHWPVLSPQYIGWLSHWLVVRVAQQERKADLCAARGGLVSITSNARCKSYTEVR